jgi:hypothetical protein
MSDERMDEYLWDPEAEADPEVERLERLLGRWRHGARVSDQEKAEAGLAALLHLRRPRLPRGLWPVPLILAAAAVLLMLRTSWTGPSYRVEGVDGISHARVGERIRVGEHGARMAIADIGEVVLDPGSRVVVQEIRTGKRALHALYMERGALHARIVAEPRVFQVGTPAGISIDLGCEYRLEVLPDDRTRVRVLTGQISFGYEGREVYVPAGAACESRPGRGPTPPMFAETTPLVRELVSRAADGERLESSEIETLVDIDERGDALPLFALMTDPAQPLELRRALFEMFRAKFETPASITADGILAGDPAQRLDWLDAVRHWWR